MNKILYNKAAKGVVSLLTVIILMSSILAGTIYNQNNITGNAVADGNSNSLNSKLYKKEVNDISELNQLNEGWYKIVSGNVLYLENFDSTVPLFIKIKNPKQQNGLLVVDFDGNIKFEADSWEVASAERVDVKTGSNLITGEVTGLESVSGMQTAQTVHPSGDIPSGSEVIGYILPNGQANTGSPPSNIKDYTLEYTYNGKSYRNKVTNGIIGDNSVLNNGVWVPVTSTATQPILPTPAGPGNTAAILPAGSAPTSQEFQNRISPYRNEIEAAYTQYPKLKEYRGIIEEMIYLESGGDHNVAGDGGDSPGLMQINDPEKDGAFGYSRQQILTPSGNILAGASKINQIINDANFRGDKRQIVYSYNQARVVTLDEVNSGNPDVIYSNYNGDKAALYNQRTQSYNQISGTSAPSTQNKIFEVTLNDGKTKVTVTGPYKTAQEVALAYNIDKSRVKEATGASTGLNSYEIYDSDGKYLETIKADSEEKANEIGAKIVTDLYKTELGRVEPPKFSMVHPDTGTEIKYSANSQADAIAQFKNDYGKDPVPGSIKQLQPGQKTVNTVTYVIRPEGTDNVIKFEVEADNPDDLETKLNKYRELFPNKKLNEEKLPTLAELQQQNPEVPRETLQRLLQNYAIGTTAEKADELRPPKAEEVKIGGKTYYLLDTVEYKNKEERDAAYNKVFEDFNKRVTETYAAKKLDGKELLKGEITPDKWLLARDSKGNIYQYVYGDDPRNGQWNVIGSTTYKRQKTIGKDENAITVIETVETKTAKITDVELTRGGITISANSDILKQIEKAGAENVRIAPSEDEKKNVIEYTDKNGQFIRTFIDKDYVVGKGEIIEEKYRKKYFDENNKEISKEEADRRNIEGRDELQVMSIIEDDKLKFVTALSSHTESRNGENVRVSQGYTIDATTGKRTNFIYRETGKDGVEKTVYLDPNGMAIDSSGNPVSNADTELENRAKKAKTQQNTRQFFADVERIFTEFRGLGYYATLFFDDDYLLKWRNNVDKAFATAYLGTQYWSSAICDGSIDAENDGIAYAETPQGLAQIGAHVEATRTPAIEDEKGKKQFIYKITFSVRNGDYEKDPRAPENMTINVKLTGGDPSQQTGSTLARKVIKLFKNDQHVSRGSVFSKAGSSAIVKNSSIIYSEICLTFDKIPEKWKIDRKEDDRYLVCNIIKESDITATTVRQSTQASRSGSQELNDI